MYRGNGSLDLRELNERNTIFWRVQSELALERLSDQTVFDLAKNDMNSESQPACLFGGVNGFPEDWISLSTKLGPLPQMTAKTLGF